MAKINKLTKEEQELENINLEAERIGNWLNQKEFTAVFAEQFIVTLLLELNLNYYEVKGILDEAKDVCRDIILNNNLEEE